MKFEWDHNKAESNLRKHGVSFSEGASVFSDWFSVTIPDPLHSQEENRYVTLGESSSSRLLVVVYTTREDSIRIISVRVATPRERRQYEQENER